MFSFLSKAVRVLSATAVAALVGTPAESQQQQSLQFMSKQCNEDAIRVHVDPGRFREFVPPLFSLALEEGKALLLILAQDCSQYWIDGENLGLTQELHVWLSINGANDNRPVVGAQLTRPTMTWLRLFHGSTNAGARSARTAAGSVHTAIEGVFLDPPGHERGGRVSLSKNLTYSWRLVSAAPRVRVIGVNHDVYAKTTIGGTLLDQIQALVFASAADSLGTLDVIGNTEMLPWIHAGTYPISVNTFFPMWARGTFGVSTTRYSP